METNYCRIRPKDNYFYAKPIFLRDGVKEEDVIKKGVVQKTSKHFDECFDNGFSRFRCPGVSKWDLYKGVYGIIDVSMLDDKTYAEYVIDFKVGIYKTIISIIKEEGFKYKKKEQLKRHVYLAIKEKHKKQFTEDVYRYSVEYFFNKSAESFNARKKRFLQKAFTNKDIWKYFVTFTYDSKLFANEEDFDSYLRRYLRHLSSRENVKYMGTFERSSKGRLHFHSIMSCSLDYLKKLNLKEERYYDKTSGEVKSTIISESLKETIGRCEFKAIFPDSDDFIHVLDYICKYISKQENKIVYARGLRDEMIGKIDNFNDHTIGMISMLSTFYLMDGQTSFKEL